MTERIAHAIKMRRNGASWADIAETLSFASARSACNSVRQALFYEDNPQAWEVLKAEREALIAERKAQHQAQYQAEVAARREARTRESRQRVIITAMREWASLFGEPPTANDWNTAQARRYAYGWRWERYQATGRSLAEHTRRAGGIRQLECGDRGRRLHAARQRRPSPSGGAVSDRVDRARWHARERQKAGERADWTRDDWRRQYEKLRRIYDALARGPQRDRNKAKAARAARKRNR